MIYLSKEEADARIESGDMEVINGIISGDVVIGEAPGEEELSAEVPVVEETIIPDAVAEETVEVEPDFSKAEATSAGIAEDEYNALVAKYKEEAKKTQEALDKAEAERVKAQEARALLESIKNKSVAEVGGLKVELPSLNEDETDADLAGSYSKNNRTILESLKDAVGSAASVDQIAALEEKLNSVLQLEESRRAEEEARAAKDAETSRMNKLFSEVDAFSQEHKHFQMNRGTADIYNDVNKFKSRLKDYLRTTDPREVEKAYRGVVTGKDSELIENLGKAGVTVPEDAESYLKLSEIVDLKNGYKFNEYTGEFEQITDNFGVRVIQRSIEDAYKLSRFSDIVAEAKAEQTQAIEQRLASRDASATTLPQDLESDGSGDGEMSLVEMEQILSLPNSAFKNNPALKQKLDAILQR